MAVSVYEEGHCGFQCLRGLLVPIRGTMAVTVYGGGTVAIAAFIGGTITASEGQCRCVY